MTAYLDAHGYAQTKTKLAELERRQAEIENRTDLSAAHRQQVMRSYHAMMQQYLREIKLYETLQQEAGRRT